MAVNNNSLRLLWIKLQLLIWGLLKNWIVNYLQFPRNLGKGLANSSWYKKEGIWYYLGFPNTLIWGFLRSKHRENLNFTLIFHILCIPKCDVIVCNFFTLGGYQYPFQKLLDFNCSGKTDMHLRGSRPVKRNISAWNNEKVFEKISILMIYNM